MKRAEQLANYLDERARSPEDNEAAQLLRRFAELYDAARDTVLSPTHVAKTAAYAKLDHLIRGKKND